MSVLFIRGKTNNVAGANLLCGATFALNQSYPARDDEYLTKRRVCQAVRAAGSKVTLAPAAVAGPAAPNRESTRTSPVNQSAGLLPEGFDPGLVISMDILLIHAFSLVLVTNLRLAARRTHRNTQGSRQGPVD